MFENPAQKLKSISKALFIISIIAAIILAFEFGVAEEEFGIYYTYTDTVFYAGRFFGILLGVPFASYIQSLCLYGFGELLEKHDTTSQDEVNISTTAE